MEKNIPPTPLPSLLKLLQPLEFPHKLGICDRLFARSLSPKGICWVQTAASIPWKLDLANVTHRWIVYGSYEGAGFLKWANAYLSSDAIVVDSGANIGQMSLYLAQLVAEGKVLAFEPGESSADWLEECVEANRLGNIELIRMALGAEAAELSLNEVGLAVRHGAQNHISRSGGVPVRVGTLSAEAATRGIDHIDLWKLDVEGYEYEALQGAESLLKRQAVFALYVEMQDTLQSRIIDYLAHWGYSCYEISWKGELKKVGRFDSFAMALFLPS